MRKFQNIMRVYLTHCSAEREPLLKDSGKTATPDALYTHPRIQEFMIRCKSMGVSWGVLSDLYDVFGSDQHQAWYEQHPDTVTQYEEDSIIQAFDRALSEYDEIWFYIRPESFHLFYGRVLKRTALADRIRTFEDIELIK
ncbi:hypothetical protein [Leptolyngbya sp. NIES-2104]|uniref:hypothetical protein n=1 Tax=Leptolyngbya sp. NIES-2104 TaxID=1552121 RepID=UPI0012E3899E|nr:hypothetical protein [Leptolyngbya sp. NIES-2104]